MDNLLSNINGFGLYKKKEFTFAQETITEDGRFELVLEVAGLGEQGWPHTAKELHEYRCRKEWAALCPLARLGSRGHLLKLRSS